MYRISVVFVIVVAVNAAAVPVVTPNSTEFYRVRVTKGGTNSSTSISSPLLLYRGPGRSEYSASDSKEEYVSKENSSNCEDHDDHQNDHHDNGDTNNDPFYSILVACIPMVALLLLVMVTCFVAHRGPASALERLPILKIFVPSHNSEETPSCHPCCNNRMTDNNVQFVHFLKALTNQVPPPVPPCKCPCCICGTSPAGTSSRSHGVVCPACPTISYKKGTEKVDIRLSQHHSDSTDSTSSGTTASTESYSEVSSNGSTPQSQMERDGMIEAIDDDQDDSPSIIDVNPFNAEYVYAALAPDVQDPSYHLTGSTVDRKTAENIAAVPVKKTKHHVTFRPDSSLETICE